MIPNHLQNFYITRKRELIKKGIDPKGTAGREWLTQKMKQLRITPQDRIQIVNDRVKQKNRTIIGRFYFFFYLPKTREKLPYWDKFPMVVPILYYPDGFLGLNLHYIAPKERLILLKQLDQFSTTAKNDERARLKLTYPLLKRTQAAYRATPCIKRYLTNHVQSKFIEIPPQEWEFAATLPVQDFRSKEGISAVEVWKISQRTF